MHQQMIGDSRGGVLGAPYLGFLRCSLWTGDWEMGLLRQDSRGGFVGGGARGPNPRCKPQHKKLLQRPQMNSKRGIFLNFSKDPILAGDDEISWAVWWRMDGIFAKVELD